MSRPLISRVAWLSVSACMLGNVRCGFVSRWGTSASSTSTLPQDSTRSSVWGTRSRTWRDTQALDEALRSFALTLRRGGLLVIQLLNYDRILGAA